LQKKQQAPLTMLETGADYSEALKRYGEMLQTIQEYNASVASLNTEIVAIKTSTATGDISRVRSELASLRLRKRRFETEVAEACDAYSASKRKKAEIAAEKDKVKQALETHAGDTFKIHQTSINKILSDVQAGFTLTDAQVEYPAGTPSTRYRIVINGEAVALGDGDTPDSEPSFKNTLSAGDKSVLALALFVSQLQHDPDVGNKIVVFDDPFSSQDSFRRDLTIRLIRECGEKAQQVIVLSHDREFLRRLWNRLADKGAMRKTLELRRVGPRNTTICALDIEDATDTWVQNRQVLVDYYMAGEGDERDVVQKIRPALETFLRVIGTPLIQPTDNLGVIATKAAAPGCPHPIATLAAEISDLNFYTNRYMHGQNPNWKTEPIDPHELQSMAYRTLQLMGGA
jgi:wobble nucleotide-excising tRNase